MPGPRILLLAVLAGAIACDRQPQLVGTPLVLSEVPIVARLEDPVHMTGGTLTLCYEFHPPGDSHAAGGISAALIETSGRRHRLVDPSLDRRGEGLVCQVGRVEDAPTGQTVVFEAIELSSAAPVRIRTIRGGQAGG
jgi:hypothetical protein